MTARYQAHPLALLVLANELDEQIRAQDVLILRATVQHVHPKFIWRAVQCRNDLAREWGALWHTRQVTP